jgi:3-methyladenine DNA glycosylase/8-oxoguanine DNA glycosylase
MGISENMTWEDILKDAESDARKLLLDYFLEIDKWAADLISEIMDDVASLMEDRESSEKLFEGLNETSREMLNPIQQNVVSSLKRAIESASEAVKMAQSLQDRMVDAKRLVEGHDIRRAIMAFRALEEASKHFGMGAPILNLSDIIHRLGFEGME